MEVVIFFGNVVNSFGGFLKNLFSMLCILYFFFVIDKFSYVFVGVWFYIDLDFLLDL